MNNNRKAKRGKVGGAKIIQRNADHESRNRLVLYWLRPSEISNPLDPAEKSLFPHHHYKILCFKPFLKFYFPCSGTDSCWRALGFCYYLLLLSSTQYLGLFDLREVHRFQIYLFICIEASSWNTKRKYIYISTGQEGVRFSITHGIQSNAHTIITWFNSEFCKGMF